MRPDPVSCSASQPRIRVSPVGWEVKRFDKNDEKRFNKKQQEETEAYGAFNESTEGAQAKGYKNEGDQQRQRRAGGKEERENQGRKKREAQGGMKTADEEGRQKVQENCELNLQQGHKKEQEE
jgi:hypothetical protein